MSDTGPDDVERALLAAVEAHRTGRAQTRRLQVVCPNNHELGIVYSTDRGLVLTGRDQRMERLQEVRELPLSDGNILVHFPWRTMSRKDMLGYHLDAGGPSDELCRLQCRCRRISIPVWWIRAQIRARRRRVVSHHGRDG